MRYLSSGQSHRCIDQLKPWPAGGRWESRQRKTRLGRVGLGRVTKEEDDYDYFNGNDGDDDDNDCNGTERKGRHKRNNITQKVQSVECGKWTEKERNPFVNDVFLCEHARSFLDRFLRSSSSSSSSSLFSLSLSSTCSMAHSLIFFFLL